MSYSLLWRAVEADIMEQCRELGLGVLAYSPLQQGLLSGRYTTLEDIPEGRRRTRLFNSARCGIIYIRCQIRKSWQVMPFSPIRMLNIRKNIMFSHDAKVTLVTYKSHRCSKKQCVN